MKWEIRLALALLIAQPVVFFRQLLVNPRAHIPFDFLGFHLPLTDYIAWSVRNGRFPLWDPTPYCGYPFHADSQTQLFYPPAWLAVAARNLLNTEGKLLYWLEWVMVLHVMLAGLLAFWMLRRMGCRPAAALFGATVFQLGAFFASQAQHLGAVCGTAWLPLVWLAVWELARGPSRKWWAALAAGLAMSFLAGFMATTLVVYFAAAALALVLVLARRANWRLLAWTGAAMVMSGLLVAVQLVPTMEWSGWSFASLKPEINSGVGIHPRALWSLLYPNALGVFTPFDKSQFKETGNFTFYYLYCGMGALGLAAFALLRRGPARWFVGLAVLFLVLQSGEYFPGFRTVFPLLPGPIRGSLYTNFFLGGFVLSLAAAAALAAGRFGNRVLWALALATAAELTWAGSGRPLSIAEGSYKWQTSEISVNGNGEVVQRFRELTAGSAPPPRIDLLDVNFTFTMGASQRRLPTPNGDSPFAPLRILDIRRRFARGMDWERQLPVDRPGSSWLEYLNVKYLVAETVDEDVAALERSGWRRIEGGVWNRLYQWTSDPQPRFFLVDQVRPAADLDAIDPRREATVEGPLPTVSSGGSVRVTVYEPERVELETESIGPAYLVSSETFAPGWKAWLDGRPAELRITNHAFRGMTAPAGTHRIEWRYEPGLRRWAALSGFSWFGLGLFALLRKRAASDKASAR